MNSHQAQASPLLKSNLQSSVPQKLLIIDSGVGGLSVFNEIRKQLPQIDSTYVADNAAYPYGTKSAEQIIQRVSHLAQILSRTEDYSALVLACNTASTIALPTLREILEIPVVGVVPAIKPAAAMSRSKVIGLLATPGTVSRDYTQQLIDQFADGCTVIKVGSSTLVDLAEHMLEFDSLDKSALREILNSFWLNPEAKNIDTIVLGCTHFPLLKDALIELGGAKEIQWVDSGAAVAKQIASILHSQKAVTNTASVSESQTAVDQPSNESSLKNGNAINSSALEPLHESLHEIIFTKQKEITPGLKTALQTMGISNIRFMPI